MYPAHTSHLFQVLDVLLFGRLKAFKKYLANDGAEDREVDHILRILRAYEAAATSMTIRDHERRPVSVIRGGTKLLTL
jgi:hypothetical protein